MLVILDDIVIFRRVANVRQDLDFLQVDVANYLKVKQATYSRWETGQEIIPLQKLYDFCCFTNFNMDYITSLSNIKVQMTEVAGKRKGLDKVLIGNRIKEIRKDLGYTQYDLAKLLNTTQSTICAYEAGRRLILTAFAYQIAKKTGVSLDWLCGLSNEKYREKVLI